VIAKKLSEEEAAFAEEIVNFRGGLYEGPPTRNFARIDGTLDGLPVIQLNLSTSKFGTFFKAIVGAQRDAIKAGYAGVELFVNAKQFSPKQLPEDPTLLPRIGAIVREGTLSAVNILTGGGWIRVVR
jgi:hypothetical protein